MKLQEFSFQVVYKTGKLHVDADILSRITHSPCTRISPRTDDNAFFSFFPQVDLAKLKMRILTSVPVFVCSTSIPGCPPVGELQPITPGAPGDVGIGCGGAIASKTRKQLCHYSY